VTQAELLIPGAKMSGVSKRGEELRESGGEVDLGLGLGLFASRGEEYELYTLRTVGKKILIYKYLLWLFRNKINIFIYIC
jgi:hypothetical protein